MRKTRSRKRILGNRPKRSIPMKPPHITIVTFTIVYGFSFDYVLILKNVSGYILSTMRSLLPSNRRWVSCSSDQQESVGGIRTLPVSVFFLTFTYVTLLGRFPKSSVPEKRFSYRYMAFMDSGSRVKSSEPSKLFFPRFTHSTSGGREVKQTVPLS